jgi:hypothetical protein
MMESSFERGYHHAQNDVVNSDVNLSIGLGWLRRGHIIDLTTLRIRLTDTRRRKADTRSDDAPSQVAKPIAMQARIETFATTERTTASLTPIPQKAPESDVHVVIEPTEGRARIG